MLRCINRLAMSAISENKQRYNAKTKRDAQGVLRSPALFGGAFPFIFVGYLIGVASLFETKAQPPPGLVCVSIRIIIRPTHRYGDIWPDLHHALTPGTPLNRNKLLRLMRGDEFVCLPLFEGGSVRLVRFRVEDPCRQVAHLMRKCIPNSLYKMGLA